MTENATDMGKARLISFLLFSVFSAFSVVQAFELPFKRAHPA